MYIFQDSNLKSIRKKEEEILQLSIVIINKHQDYMTDVKSDNALKED